MDQVSMARTCSRSMTMPLGSPTGSRSGIVSAAVVAPGECECEVGERGGEVRAGVPSISPLAAHNVRRHGLPPTSRTPMRSPPMATAWHGSTRPEMFFEIRCSGRRTCQSSCLSRTHARKQRETAEHTGK